MRKGIYVLLTAAAALLGGCAKESMSIGIIGGADGPTKVFIVAAPFWWVPLALLAAAVAAVLGLVIMRRRNR